MVKKEEEKDKKSKKTAAIVTFGVHAVVLLLCFFLLAWQPPDPPRPSYGVELNFGLDDAGSGDQQALTPAAQETQQPDNSPPPAQPEPVQETAPEPEPVAEPVTEAAAQPTDVSNADSPDYVEEKPTPKPTPKPVEKPKEKPAEAPPAYNPTQNTGTGKGAKANNNGDKPGAVGDQGSPEGKVDAKALYGNPGSGGGGGGSLDMAGWMWDAAPKPKDNSNEEGKIVFKVEVDDEGEIISIRTIEKTVSPAPERIYRQEVERLTFSKTSGSNVASKSTGTITFIIRTK